MHSAQRTRTHARMHAHARMYAHLHAHWLHAQSYVRSCARLRTCACTRTGTPPSATDVMIHENNPESLQTELRRGAVSGRASARGWVRQRARACARVYTYVCAGGTDLAPLMPFDNVCPVRALDKWRSRIAAELHTHQVSNQLVVINDGDVRGVHDGRGRFHRLRLPRFL